MVLTVCLGASGSGKTTFLQEVHKSHKCTYIRQYHSIRPFIQVNKIPNFDPTELPYWDIYVKEQPYVKVGGTMAGQFTAGLSGGQRKMLLFELIYQRTKHLSGLLICLDEPFAGVTDGFLPYLQGRVDEIRKKHNLLLVTNDHVSSLTSQADNILTVSATDRTVVKINDKDGINREMAIHALSSGNVMDHTHASDKDITFFFETEVFSPAGGLGNVAGFTVFVMLLFLVSYWDSKPGSESLIIVAIQIISYFCINPYLLALADWRNYMMEETEALLHTSPGAYKALKVALTLVVLVCISSVAFGVLNAVINTMQARKFYGAMFFDSASLTFPFLCIGLYTDLPMQMVQISASLPFIFMIFFSTTFSPGAGVEGVKDLRYLFPRFFFWCMVPGVQDLMEGCPNNEYLMLYIAISGCIGLVLFLFFMGFVSLKHRYDNRRLSGERQLMTESIDFKELQVALYGEGERFSNSAGKTVGRMDGFNIVPAEDERMEV